MGDVAADFSDFIRRLRAGLPVTPFEEMAPQWALPRFATPAPIPAVLTKDGEDTPGQVLIQGQPNLFELETREKRSKPRRRR